MQRDQASRQSALVRVDESFSVRAVLIPVVSEYICDWEKKRNHGRQRYKTFQHSAADDKAAGRRFHKTLLGGVPRSWNSQKRPGPLESDFGLPGVSHRAPPLRRDNESNRLTKSDPKARKRCDVDAESRGPCWGVGSDKPEISDQSRDQHACRRLR